MTQGRRYKKKWVYADGLVATCAASHKINYLTTYKTENKKALLTEKERKKKKLLNYLFKITGVI